MPKYLIIFAHPKRDSHSGYMLEQVEKRLKAASQDFETLDLYQMNYDPILKKEELYGDNERKVATETLIIQDKIRGAKRLIFIYPTWWQAPPAILKGFIDRVFTSKFAFVYKQGMPIGLLGGKKAAVFTTTGSPRLIIAG